LSARLAAAELLVAVRDHHRALDDALNDTQSYTVLSGRDRAFARALASAALRRCGSIELTLSRFLQRPLPESAELARALLHIGAAQILVLGTPPHAAVGETVAAANSHGKARGFAKLMNAVLRRVSREGAPIFESAPTGADLPAWLYTRWRATYGDQAAAIARALRAEPPLDLTVKDDAQSWAANLDATLTPTGSVRLFPHAIAETTSAPSPQGRGPVDRIPGYDEGAWWVQDAAAALPARMFGDVKGKRALDMCAAPGGKTLQLAAAGAHVVALDKAQPRLERLRENLARTKLKAEVVCADALAYRGEAFDLILLDAPCTATGTLRRHPDIAWLRRPSDIAALSALQARLIDAAAALLKPDGVLVYAVCSLEPEEGEAVVANALKRGWRRSPLTANEISGAAPFITPAGDLRTLPAHWHDIGGLDGFFAARLLRP
jgi:16S rRNA (cytosine967-C5)-methyltransferase